MSVPIGDGRPRLVGRTGSLDAFWPLVEPVLAALAPRRLCEIGVDQGIFTRRLLAWVREHGCAYVGIDPATDPVAAALIEPPGWLILGRSLEVLPGLEPCEAYFIDGDHNYHTVRGELELITRATPGAGPVIFAHDISWPWARRDMYHDPDAIPPEARHPASADLGVSLDGDELVPGGLRSPGRYAVAQRPGGERNGVRTALEDFLNSDAGRAWQTVWVPMAFGLAILYRPDAVPAECRTILEQLDTATRTLGDFLGSSEANFLSLYLYAEAAKSHQERLQQDYEDLSAAHRKLGGAYEELSSAHKQLGGAYEGLSVAYQSLSAHSERLMQDYDRLMTAYRELERATRPGDSP